MSLLRYLKPINGLPDPKGSLSTTMSRASIASANQEVQKELNATKKRGQYKKYSPEERSAIGKYSTQHGAAATAKHSSKLWAVKISGTVKSIKKAYLDELRKRPRSDDGGEMTALHPKKRGRKLLLGEDLDAKVQIYLRKVREGGGAVSSRIALAAARGTMFDMYIKILSSRYYSMNFYNYRYPSQIQPLSACPEWRASRVKQVLGSLPNEANEVRSEKSYNFQVQVFIGGF